VNDPLGRVTNVAGGVVEATGELPRILGRATDFARRALQNPVGAGHTIITSAWATASDVADSVGSTVRAAVPGSGALVDMFSAAPGDVDTIRKLLLGTRNVSTIWTGTAGRDKGVAWSEPVSLAEVKAVAKANGCTVNW
jgi:diacylglycerol O-acyltransferase